jgi:hypothetical protein
VRVASTIEIGPRSTTVVVTGAVGPPGPPGPGGASYRHIQNTPAAVWTIVHGLGFWPNVTTVDTAHTVVEGSTAYSDVNTVVITFSAPVAGEAYLS